MLSYWIPTRNTRFTSARVPTRPVVVIVTRNHQDELQRYLSKLTNEAWFREGGVIHVLDLRSLDRTKAVADAYIARYPGQITWTSKSVELSPERWFARLLDASMIEIVNLPAMDRARGYLAPSWWSSWAARLRRPIRSDGRKPDAERIVEGVERERARVYECIRDMFLEPLAHVEMVHAHAEADNPERLLERMRDIYRKSSVRLRAAALLFDPQLWKGESLYTNAAALCGGFTDRTHIPCDVAELGEERPLPRYVGISVMRMLAETLLWLADVGGTAQVRVRIRWRRSRVDVVLRVDGARIDAARPFPGMESIELRAAMIGGSVRWRKDGAAFAVPLEERSRHEA